MPRRSNKLATYRQAVQKAADWIESKQNADGSIDPAGGIGSIYKTSFALVAAGRLHAAWRLMDYIVDHWMDEPGEFHAPGEDIPDAALHYYRNCYILKAALRLGRFDIASPAALDHFYRYQHRSGGFCASLLRSGRRQIDPLHTCMGGWISLYTSRLDRAAAAGDFLLALIRSQPRWPQRFYFHTDARTGRCITDYECGTGIAHFADRIHYVHFRDVDATVPRFAETFHDNGITDMAAAISAYRSIGFDGPMRPDHVPTLEGESTDNAGYTMLGRLFAVGYMKGLIEATAHGA